MNPYKCIHTVHCKHAHMNKEDLTERHLHSYIRKLIFFMCWQPISWMPFCFAYIPFSCLREVPPRQSTLWLTEEKAGWLTWRSGGHSHVKERSILLAWIGLWGVSSWPHYGMKLMYWWNRRKQNHVTWKDKVCWLFITFVRR